jgi:hypothetical protein
MVAQFLQKSTYEEVQTIVTELLDTVEQCKSLKSPESPLECAHQLVGGSSVFCFLFFFPFSNLDYKQKMLF